MRDLLSSILVSLEIRLKFCWKGHNKEEKRLLLHHSLELEIENLDLFHLEKANFILRKPPMKNPLISISFIQKELTDNLSARALNL